jgi:Family of unknown function (DUF6156)
MTTVVTDQIEAIDLSTCTCRYFVSYSGVQLPLKLVTPLEPSALANRNTYFRAYYDGADRLVLCEKITYNEVELLHRYRYHDNGPLKQAVIVNSDQEVTVMTFDEQGTASVQCG